MRRAELFKALGNSTRLLIVNLIRLAPRHGEELADILKLSPATVSHHLAKLSEVGLLTARKDQYYQIYSLTGDLNRTLGELVNLAQPGTERGVREDAYREKVLKAFFVQGCLTQLPAQLKKRRIVLERLVEEFEPERDYPEREVNLILADFHDDFATLRRHFVGEGLMVRERGIYRRTDAPKGT